MKRQLSKIVLCTLVIVALASCNLPGYNGGFDEAEIADRLQTVVLQTLTAAGLVFQFTPTPTAPPIIITATPEADDDEAQEEEASPTPESAAKPATVTPPPTLTPGYKPVAPQPTIPPLCYHAQFVSDVTIQDNTRLAPGESFTKTWRLRNIGSCNWNTSFELVYISGDQMNGSSVNLPKSVAPGQTVDVSVQLKAPSTPKTYQGFWKLQNDSGKNFGIGYNAATSFWVKIVVSGTPAPTKTPTRTPTTPAAFTVTTASVSMVAVARPVYNPPDCTGSHAFTVSANITTNGAGTVTYRWDGVFEGSPSSTENRTEVFAAAGTKTVTHSFSIPVPTTEGQTVSGSSTLFVISPNNTAMGTANWSVTCAPP